MHGIFLLSVLLTSFSSLARLPVTILRPTGLMQFFSWELYDRLLTPEGMLALKCALVVSLTMSTFGYLTGFSTKASALLVIFYQGLLRSYGHFNHDEMLGVYYLIILAFTPCGDSFSIDSLPRTTQRRGRSFIYGYPILLMRILMAWVYFSSALLKIRVGGLGYFNPDSLPSLAISHSLDNLHDTHFRVAFWLPEIRQYLPLAVGAIVVWELLFPLAVWWKRARPLILGFGVLFHFTTLVLMNIFFPFQLAMYLVFVDWPASSRRVASMRPFKGAAKCWRNFRRAPEQFPGISVSALDGQSVLLWDGDNVSCARWVRCLQRFATPNLVTQPYQSLQDELPVQIRRWSKVQVHWVSHTGRVYGGSRALIEGLSASGHGFLAAFLESAPLRPLVWFAYRFAARAR
ncbi:MAG: HTTM domain-containing protein [Acidobacteria bacterium]|nr:HTTM domain-containing protein [Acidobacteriota bacterium]